MLSSSHKADTKGDFEACVSLSIPGIFPGFTYFISSVINLFYCNTCLFFSLSKLIRCLVAFIGVIMLRFYVVFKIFDSSSSFQSVFCKFHVE